MNTAFWYVSQNVIWKLYKAISYLNHKSIQPGPLIAVCVIENSLGYEMKC